MPLEPRPELRNLGTCPHGGIDYAELAAAGIAPKDVLDFSVCINPFMPPPEIKAMRLDGIDIAQYPDSESTELRGLLAERRGVAPDCILVASGTTELIRLIALAYLRPGDNILTLFPTYGEYEVAAAIAGAGVIKQLLKASDSFRLPVGETANLIRQHRPRAVFLCNPNNPTGQYLLQSEVEAVMAALEDGLLVLDEAYVSFVEDGWPSVELISRGNVAVLRSMTKDYGLAGLRLGYAIASQEITENLRRVLPPWSVNAVAQRAGAILLRLDDCLAPTRGKIKEARRYLTGELSRLGLPPLPSATHFFLVKVGEASRFRAALLWHGILVRDCTSFGLPDYIRLGTRSLPECHRLIAAIEELKHKGEIDVPG